VTVCLQGGGELSPGCREMDGRLAALAEGPWVVTTLAGEVGRQYTRTNAQAVGHFRELGVEVVDAPDVRQDPDGALAALRSARTVVLPGGSPSRLLQNLTETPLGQLLVDLVADGGSVMGASAGAMVLCEWTVLPDRPDVEGRPTVARGLGVVPGTVVVPHWRGPRQDWLTAIDGLPEPVEVLGLPEESGVLLTGGTMTGLGQRPTRLVSRDTDVAVGQSVPWDRT
jgi:cyanophycinase